MKHRIAILTTATKNMGMGHLTRMAHLADYLQSKFETHFFVETDENSIHLLDEKRMRYRIIKLNEDHTLIRSFEPHIIFVDKRDTIKQDLKRLQKIAKVITFDNAGETEFANFVINALPLPDDLQVQSNFSGKDYLIFNDEIEKHKKIYPPSRVNSILVTFGGSDPAGLTEYVYKILLEIDYELDIKIVLGPLYKGREDFPPFETIRTKNLLEEIEKADLVITGFGMTAYESIFIGTYPVLINPSKYHDKLASTLEFGKNLGTGGSEQDIDRIKKSLIHMIETPDICRNFFKLSRRYLDNNAKERVKKITQELIKKPVPECSVCGKANMPVVFRKKDFNIYFCENCNTLFRDKDYTVSNSYDSDYFLNDYKNQYGKTYLDDKNNINILNLNRLDVIDEIVTTKRPVKPVLELGCAMGFFLEKAEKRGYEPHGIEISRYAASYCKYTAKLDVECGDFLAMDYSRPVYEIVAMWYFIEHIKDFKKIIEKSRTVLRDKGIIAISTPNCYGISGQKNVNAYASKIPDDHYNEFSPASLKYLLNENGFKVEKIISTGIHYKRWLNGRKNIFLNNPIAERIYNFLARKKYLGDTFEIYARKVSPADVPIDK